VLQVRLDGLVLFVELGHVRHKVLHNIHVREGVDPAVLARISLDAAKTSESVDTINVHGARSTDTFSARAAESKGRIHLIFDFDQRVQDHRAALI